MKTGLGVQGFIWWEGVVEDNTDPLAIGRCRVRCLGWDSASKLDIPTEDLPWAYPVLPLNSPNKIVGLKPGTRVLGFFRDGESAQDRVMLGVINTGTNYVASNYVSAGLGGALGALGAVAGPLTSMTPMIGKLSETIPGVDEIASTVTDTVNQVQDQIDSVVGQVTDAVGEIADEVSGTIEGVVGQATDVFGDVSSQVTEQVQDTVGGVLDDAKNIIKQ